MDVESRYTQVAGLEVRYTVRGIPGADWVLLSHGLARSGEDFEFLAARLARRYRVVCPDMIGRGLSQWSPAPARDYCLEVYAEVSRWVLLEIGARTVRWVGTSMGGTIGIRLAGEPSPELELSHLVLNDTGPVRAAGALARIRQVVGEPPVTATVAELEGFFRRLYAATGKRSDADWRRLTERSMRRTDDGRCTCLYDPRIVAQFEHHPEDFDLWHWYERARAKTLCLRGARSDLLTPEVAASMAARGPRAQIEEIPDVGHAPDLDNEAQAALVERFLAA